MRKQYGTFRHHKQGFVQADVSSALVHTCSSIADICLGLMVTSLMRMRAVCCMHDQAAYATEGVQAATKTRQLVRYSKAYSMCRGAEHAC